MNPGQASEDSHGCLPLPKPPKMRIGSWNPPEEIFQEPLLPQSSSPAQKPHL